MRIFALPYRASILVFLVSAILFFWAKWNQFPTNIHAWTQSDRIALAYCFVDNNLNLLKPCTYDLGTKEGVTPAGIPIAEFISAVFMKFFGKSLGILQLIHMLFFGMALYFLERLTKLIKIEEIGRLAVLSLFAFSPTLIYYADGILTSVPSLSLFFGGVLFTVASQSKKKIGASHILSAALFFLAICNRWSFFLPVAAVLASLIFIKFKKLESTQWIELFPAIIAVGLSLLVYWHDRVLAAEYGSAFLSTGMQAADLEEFVEIIKRSFANWSGHWMSRIQVIWLLLMFTTSMWQSKKPVARQPLFQYIVPFSFLAGFAYTIVMVKQFENHDYYFIDAFYPFLILLAIGFYPVFREKHKNMHKWFGILTGISILFWVLQAKEVEAKRDASGLWNKVEMSYRDFQGAEEFLDHENVKADEVLLIPNSYTTNIPHLLTGRKGHALVDTDSTNLDSVLNLYYDYALIQNRYLQEEVLEVCPSIAARLTRVADNGLLSLYVKSNSTNTTEQFLGIDGEMKSEEREDSVAVSGEEFAFVRSILTGGKSMHAFLEFDLKSKIQADLSLSMKSGENKWRYDLDYGIEASGKNEIYLSWPKGTEEIEFFIFNPNKSELELSNYRIRIY